MFRLPRLRDLDESLSFRFAVPVILENCLTIFIGMAVSMVVSGISASALAAIGMANTVFNFISAFFAIITSSISILVARQVGAEENEDAKSSIEQATFLALLSSLILTVLFTALAAPMMRLLMPTAEDFMFREAVRYFRAVMLSLPFLILWSVFSGACRALGNSKIPMFTAIAVNLTQLFFSWLTVSVLGLNEIGAGLALMICRFVGAAILFVTLMKDHRLFILEIKNMLRPRWEVCRRILRIGLPMSFESFFVQVGYMLANSMAIGLGTFQSGVYQILNTVNGFTSVPQAIGSIIAMSAIGHLLGRKNYKDVKKAGLAIWVLGIASSAILGAVAVILGKSFTGLYSADPETVAVSAGLMWVLLPFNAVGTSVNMIDPQLKVGGDVKYVMVITLITVWVIRLPLTYFMCFHWDMGVFGIFFANTVALSFRAAMGLVRYFGNRWMYKKV